MDANGQVKGIVVTANGDAEVLKIADINPGAPGPGQVLVRVMAAGINYIDVYQRVGRYQTPLPYTPGLEGAGTVEAVGEGVHDVKVGDRVAYNGNLGAYAQKALVKGDDLIPLPDDISFEQGAAFPLQGMTAHYLLHEFKRIVPGERVLVHAAAGGMGLLLSQWLKHLGAEVIGTVSSEAKAKLAREAGCAHTINYQEKSFVEEVNRITSGKGCPLVIDGVGKTTFPGSLEAVSKRGTVIIFGSASGPCDPIEPNSLQKKSITVCGGSLFNFLDTRHELLARSSAVLNGIKHGWLKLNISHTFPLAQAAEAHKLLESRQSTGKIILSCE
ncbi:MAG: quinone oxidoreductase [Cyanobacteria bacterium SZAS LIN-2]|nr:quinone oxidoreductase [Cyanobacteria bacterium SZAS LIN-2]